MLKILIHMQRVKCNKDIVKVFKKRIKSVARILFEKIIFLFDERMRRASPGRQI
jgi:hypothetical protein